MFENEKFYTKLIIVGDSKGITIPANLIKGMGLQVGDELVVMIRKKEVGI